MHRKWDIEDREENQRCLDEVITRLQDIEDPERIGVIAAQDIVDIVLENLAPTMYNKGLADAQKLLSDKLTDIDTEINLLKQ